LGTVPNGGAWRGVRLTHWRIRGRCWSFGKTTLARTPIPVVLFSAVTWIVNAAAVFRGGRGEVSRRAGEAGCSRQTIYQHAEKVQDALLRPTREEFERLRGERERLQRENQQLWDWLAQTIEFPRPRQEEFSASAAAMGLSLTQTAVLLVIVMGSRAAPSRSTIGRWVAAACQKAADVLRVLDRACCPLVAALCLDEIFFRRQPVLVGVEPASMAWVIGQRTEDRSGSTWLEALRPWEHLESAIADGGTGLQSGLKQLNETRASQPGAPLIDVALDVFHTQQEALPLLIRSWKSAEQLWETAEAADRGVARCQKRGQDSRAACNKARAAWDKAEAAFHHAESLDAVWQRASAALSLFRADGSLNDRPTAAAELAAVVEQLPGEAWAKVRRMLTDDRTLTFLDRMHRQLTDTGIDPALQTELTRLYWLRRQQRSNSADPVLLVRIQVQTLLCQRLSPPWIESYRHVARVLRAVVRASSLVECMNSVIRMHQSRHRLLSQPLLDLKRLYWNCRPFREGHRQGRSPYAHLGLNLPTNHWWTLLNTTPANLAQKL
jgi:hypothetical protein